MINLLFLFLGALIFFLGVNHGYKLGSRQEVDQNNDKKPNRTNVKPSFWNKSPKKQGETNIRRSKSSQEVQKIKDDRKLDIPSFVKRRGQF
jgi:hypothetical protein